MEDNNPFRQTEGVGQHCIGGPMRGQPHEPRALLSIRSFGNPFQRGDGPNVHYLVAEDIAAGSLVRVLPRYESTPRPMQIVYLPDRRLSPKLRNFIDFLVKRYGGD